MGKTHYHRKYQAGWRASYGSERRVGTSSGFPRNSKFKLTPISEPPLIDPSAKGAMGARAKPVTLPKLKFLKNE
jgi:hypothetical protein